MIIVWGRIRAAEGQREALLAVSLDHVRRSREEDGCIEHGAYLDAEDPDRVVFFEKWADDEALRRHFAVPESGAFVRRARELADGEPSIEIYRSEPVRI